MTSVITPDPLNGGQFGGNVQVSADGLTAIVGNLCGESRTPGVGAVASGSARVHDWNGTSWVQRGDPMRAAKALTFSDDAWGASVAIPDDRMTALVGSFSASADNLVGPKIYAGAVL